MFVAAHSKVVHFQAPVILLSTVNVGDHLATVDRAAHGAPPIEANRAQEVLALRYGVLQSHQPPSNHVAAGHPDETVLVEPDLRPTALAGWGSHGNFCKVSGQDPRIEEGFVT